MRDSRKRRMGREEAKPVGKHEVTKREREKDEE
jgi:hypothetical protein